jgi:hypothetical protein
MLLVQQVPLVHAEQLDHKELLVQVSLVHKALKASLDPQVHRDQLVHKGRLVHKVNAELLVQQAQQA